MDVKENSGRMIPVTDKQKKAEHEWICPLCGTTVAKADKTCYGCGVVLLWATDEEDEARIFSSGSEFEMFARYNCNQCARYATPEEDESWAEVDTCPVENQIWEAATQREEWPADKLRQQTIHHPVACTEFEIDKEVLCR